jgi:hypothetical protein
MSELYIPYEATAREISDSILKNSTQRIPDELLALVSELMVDACHEGIELGHAISTHVDDEQTQGEIYLKGYFDGYEDGSEIEQ